MYVLDRQHPRRGFVAVHEGVESMARPLFAGDRLLLHTNRDAPNWAVYEVDPTQPSRTSWRAGNASLVVRAGSPFIKVGGAILIVVAGLREILGDLGPSQQTMSERFV